MTQSKDKNLHTEPPFGTFAPQGVRARLIALCRTMPRNWAGRRGAGLIRRAAMAGLRTPLDLRSFGAPVRFHPFDNLAEKRAAFMPQFFDPVERQVLARHIHPGFVFIDIGANAGLYALFVAVRAGAQAKIIAVEPQPEMLRRLHFNVAAGGFEQIAIEPVALAAAAGEAVLHIVHKNRGASGITSRNDTPGGDSVRVRTMALLALMDKHGIERADAIKIDIEGAEDQVLPPFFAICPKQRLPKMLIIERNAGWHTDCLALARTAGYVETVRARNNAVLRLPED